MENNENINFNVAKLFFLEYQKARGILKFPPFNSFHEGYAVLLEEVNELWDEIKKKRTDRNSRQIAYEAIQVGAMALALIKDCLDPSLLDQILKEQIFWKEDKMKSPEVHRTLPLLTAKCAACNHLSQSHFIEQTTEGKPPQYRYGECQIRECECEAFATGFGQSIQMNEYDDSSEIR